jgi:hypothetical protein
MRKTGTTLTDAIYGGPLDQETPSDGAGTLRATLVLNPRFVEALMGWPDGWTDCGFSGMESSPRRPH